LFENNTYFSNLKSNS